MANIGSGFVSLPYTYQKKNRKARDTIASLGSETAKRWAEEGTLVDDDGNPVGGGGGDVSEREKFSWKQMMDMMSQDRAERSLEQDWLKHKDSESRQLMDQRFKQAMELEKLKLSEAKNLVDDLQNTYMQSNDNPSLQRELMESIRAVMGGLPKTHQAMIQPYLKAGVFRDSKLKLWESQNPKPSHRTDPETDPVAWATEEFTIRDWSARKKGIALGETPEFENSFILGSVQTGEHTSHQIAIRDPSKKTVQVVNSKLGATTLMEYTANGGVKEKSELTVIGGRKTMVSQMKDPFTGRSWVKKEVLEQTNDPFEGTPHADFVNKMRTAFAADGNLDDKDKAEPYYRVYERTKRMLDKGTPAAATQAINDMLTRLAPGVNAVVVPKQELEDTWGWEAWPLTISEDKALLFFPGKQVILQTNSGKELPFVYDSVNQTYYTITGKPISEEEIRERLAK